MTQQSAPSPHQHETRVMIDQTAIQIRSIGPFESEKPMWVLLHEGLGSITQWRDFPHDLWAATGYSVLVYDRPGYGRSSPIEGDLPDDFLLQQAHLLPRLLQALSINKVLLFGHSDGGTLALLVAALYPDLPLLTITEAAHVLIEPITRQGLQGLLHMLTTEPDFVNRLLRHHPQADRSMLTRWVKTWLRPSLADWSMLDLLPSIRCPVLALQGTEDEHGSPAQLETIRQRVSGPADTSLLHACGHVPHLEARQQVLEHVTAFLHRHLPPSVKS